MRIDARNVKAISEVCSAILYSQSVNTSVLAAFLPRDAKIDKGRSQVIYRLLKNESIVPNKILSGYVREAIKHAAKNGKTVVLALDQTKISDGFECLAVYCRVGDRAVPIAFRVKEMEGGMGFDEQEPLLNDLVAMIPDGVDILLAADRFYGHPNLIRYCQEKSCQYRVRLKKNLSLLHQGGELSVEELLELKLQGIEGANLCDSAVVTSIGVLHEEGHEEPWFIALNGRPTPGKVLDYGM